MSSADNQGRGHELQKKIVGQMRSIGKGSDRPITAEELQKLKSAANRLDQKLKESEDAERQSLRNAAARLDQLLSDIRSGKDLSNLLKR